jgi:hypothetical protein
MKRCHRCKAPWESVMRQPGVKEICENCSAYVHCCLNCRFYNPAMSKACATPTADLVVDKEGLNFCDEFEFADESQQKQADHKQSKARQALDGLLGESEAPSDDERLDAFKGIFGD